MGLNPFPEGGGDPGRKGLSLKHFSRGEGGRAESSRRKGGEEVMEGGRKGGGRGRKEGEGGGEGGGEVEGIVGAKGKVTESWGTRGGDITERMRAAVMT